MVAPRNGNRRVIRLGCVRPLGSGGITREVIAAAELLVNDRSMLADVWCGTSFASEPRAERMKWSVGIGCTQPLSVG